MIRSQVVFVGLALLRGTARSLKAGEYEVPQGAPLPAVLQLLETGRVKPHLLVLPEGFTIRDLARQVEAEGIAPAERRHPRRPQRPMAWSLGIESDSLEGYLFPDTYQVTKGMRVEEILGRMVQRFRDRAGTAEVVARARQRGLSLHQLVTLASIVEKEAALAAERPVIARVFLNRLRLDMPLQADPTVAYALAKEGRAPTREDLQIDHPFNTYRNRGLPPGPIGSPGRAAIDAVLEPANVAVPLLRGHRRPGASLLHDPRGAQPGRGAVPAVPAPGAHDLDACARQRPDAMKARDRYVMNPNWKNAPSALRPAAAPVADEPERLPAVYAGLKRVLPPLLRRFFAFRVSGLEHLPEQGPYIVAANHANYLDGVVLAIATAPEDQLPGHAARLPGHAASSVLPRPHGLDPGLAGAARSRGHPAGPPGARARGAWWASSPRARSAGTAGSSAASPAWPSSRSGPASRSSPPPSRARFHALAARRFFVPRRVPLSRTLRQAPPLHHPAAAGDAGAPGRRDRMDHGGDRRAAGRGRVPGAGGPVAMTGLTGPAPKSPWGGRFAEPADASARAFTASLPFDYRLWPHDLQGSEAWAQALAKGGVLSEAELDAILRGLGEVRQELETGVFPYRIELEDIHMNIERRLIEKIGAVGGKLHTGRSRNDQIALDMRLWLRGEIDAIRLALREVQAALFEQAERHRTCPMPGYTHLQRAQPVLLAHHLLAYVFMLARDRERLADARRRLDVCPLGAAALAGTTVPVDRHALAQALGFRAADARTAWTPCRIATSRWSSARRRRSRPPTCPGSPRSSCCGRRPSSGSSTSPTPTPPGRRSCRRRRTRTWQS